VRRLFDLLLNGYQCQLRQRDDRVYLGIGIYGEPNVTYAGRAACLASTPTTTDDFGNHTLQKSKLEARNKISRLHTMADPIDEDDVIDIEEDEGDSDEDDSDDGVLFQQPTILMGGPNNNGRKGSRIPVAPSATLSWQQDAILECLQLAVESHDAPHTAFRDMPTWNAPPFFPPPQQQQQSETADAGDQTGITNNSTTDPTNELTGWEPKELQLPPRAAHLEEKERSFVATTKEQ
jgi:hypothetical protein